MDLTSLQTPAVPRAFSPGSASSGSDSAVVSDYGLKRALNRKVQVQPNRDPTKKELKDAEYLNYIDKRHEELLGELDAAALALEAIDNQRYSNDDPTMEGHLNKAYLKANNRMTRAEREYNCFVSDIADLRDMAPLSREAMEAGFSCQKTKQKVDRSREDRKLELEHQEDEKAKLEKQNIELRAEVKFLHKAFDSVQEDANGLRGRNQRMLMENTIVKQELAGAKWEDIAFTQEIQNRRIELEDENAELRQQLAELRVDHEDQGDPEVLPTVQQWVASTQGSDENSGPGDESNAPSDIVQSIEDGEYENAHIGTAQRAFVLQGVKIFADGPPSAAGGLEQVRAVSDTLRQITPDDNRSALLVRRARSLKRRGVDVSKASPGVMPKIEQSEDERKP